MTIKALSIEDDENTQILLEHVVSQFGPDLQLSFASSFRKGIEALAENSFDLVLLDLMLPDSPRVPENVRAVVDAAQGAAVVIVSGMSPADEVAEHCLLAGAREYISKQDINEDAARMIRKLRRVHLANLGMQK